MRRETKRGEVHESVRYGTKDGPHGPIQGLSQARLRSIQTPVPFLRHIVSNPLDAEKQARKHMALDAMVDLWPDIQIDSVRSVAKHSRKS